MQIEIPGPAGTLEATLDADTSDARRFAVLCHPHPQYGGTMFDAVLDVLAGACRRAGVGVLRFNFRGVGRSTGSYDGGPGEVDDLLAVVAWLRSEHEVGELWLGGYSFGANVTWKALSAAGKVERVLLVAPPVGAMPFDEIDPGCPVHAFAGDADEFVDAGQLAAWEGIDVQVIGGANHFFMGAWEELSAAIDGVLAAC